MTERLSDEKLFGLRHLTGFSHRQIDKLFSGSTVSPTFLKPHFSKTRVEPLISASVCARIVFTRVSRDAKSMSAFAASVA